MFFQVSRVCGRLTKSLSLSSSSVGLSGILEKSLEVRAADSMRYGWLRVSLNDPFGLGLAALCDHSRNKPLTYPRRMFVVNPKQLRSPAFGVSLSAATVALAILFALTVVTPPAVQAQTYGVIYAFSGDPDGAGPYAGLTMDRGGKLYGTTHSGNSGTNWGNVYQLQHKGSGWVFNPLGVFDGTLSARAVFGPDGLIYSTSPNNIAGYVYGYVFNMRPGVKACTAAICPWNISLLYAFSGAADGGSPRYGDLNFDQAGNIYGTTPAGGSGSGVVYEMMHSGPAWTEQPLYTFSGPDGAQPYAGVIFDNAGNLYGTTSQGGAYGYGTVYELSPAGNGWTEKVLYSFQGGSDGSSPIAGLIFDQAGNLYGATENGGSGGGGTAFELTPSGGSWTFNLLYSFNGGTNCGPRAALVMDGTGNLYGTTFCDGANNLGSIFKLTPSSPYWTYGSLYDFTGGSDGSQPISNVIFDTAGNLYGTASTGGNHSACGSYGCGVVWKITP